jgi:hypothetical protein
MGGVERVGDLDCHFQQGLEFHGASGDPILECHAIQELHGDERLLVVLSDFVDRADVGMVQRGGGTRFAAEAFERMRIIRYFGRQKLERDEAAQFGVLRLVDDAHATATEFLEDAIVRNDAADHVGKMLAPNGTLPNSTPSSPDGSILGLDYQLLPECGQSGSQLLKPMPITLRPCSKAF